MVRQILFSIAFYPLLTTSQIDPVAVYRLWNTYHQDSMERLHLPTPWHIVEPFLRQNGYRLKTHADVSSHSRGGLFDGSDPIDSAGLLYSTEPPYLRYTPPPGYVRIRPTRFLIRD